MLPFSHGHHYHYHCRFLRQGLVDEIALGRGQDEVGGRVQRHLVGFGPDAEVVEVAAFVVGVEVGEGVGRGAVPPDLAEDAGVGCAHQLLADDVEAVG